MFKKGFVFLLWPLLINAQTNSLVEEWKNDKDLKNAGIGFCVMNARTSEVISEYNSQLSLVPGSTLKIITTSAALGSLGPDFRYETKLCYTGTFNKDNGLLNGDLIITGSGDPTLQSDYFSNYNQPVTDKWAKILKEKGIREIRGKIIGDASCFPRIVPGEWIWADISNYFGAIPCGLSFMDNKFQIIYTSKEAGSKTTVTGTSPNYFNTTYTITSNVIAKGSEDEAYVYGSPFSYDKEVSGTIPPKKINYEVEAALPDPALLCAEALYTSLIEIGIRCDKKLVVSVYGKTDTLLTKQLLYSHFSPNLEKIIYYTNLKSNNHYCESLLWTLGKGDFKKGIESVKSYWHVLGLDIEEVFMVDGSGLSRANTITPAAEAKLLSLIYRDGSYYKIFNNSLPIAGKTGGMSNIGKGKYTENNMRAKTGYINRARGYCGFVKTKSGLDLSFSILFNNYNCSPKEAKIKMEKFLVSLGEL